jgi:hypothetical protein
VRYAWIALLALAGCDRVERRPYPAAGSASAAAARPADAPPVRAAMGAMVTAAQKMTATCGAGLLRYQDDPRENYYPRYINPCIPERCTPSAADLEALAGSVKQAGALLDGDPRLDLPSLRGLVALGESMAGFARVAMGGKPRAGEEGARLSGLSMHHAALVVAFQEIYPDDAAPIDPPSLTTSLAVPDPGGDPCKWWRIPRFCDVAKVHVSSPLRWRTNPPCIEVTTDPRAPSRF